MPLKTKKILEVLCFLFSCGVAIALCCVPMSFPVQLILLIAVGVFPGVPTFGWGRERWEFLQRTRLFHAGSCLTWILFFVILVLGETMLTFWGTPELQQRIMVNGGFVFYLTVLNASRDWAYVLYLFAPQKIRFREQMEEK